MPLVVHIVLAEVVELGTVVLIEAVVDIPLPVAPRLKSGRSGAGRAEDNGGSNKGLEMHRENECLRKDIAKRVTVRPVLGILELADEERWEENQSIFIVDF